MPWDKLSKQNLNLNLLGKKACNLFSYNTHI